MRAFEIYVLKTQKQLGFLEVTLQVGSPLQTTQDPRPKREAR